MSRYKYIIDNYVEINHLFSKINISLVEGAEPPIAILIKYFNGTTWTTVLEEDITDVINYTPTKSGLYSITVDDVVVKFYFYDKTNLIKKANKYICSSGCSCNCKSSCNGCKENDKCTKSIDLYNELILAIASQSGFFIDSNFNTNGKLNEAIQKGIQYYIPSIVNIIEKLKYQTYLSTETSSPLHITNKLIGIMYYIQYLEDILGIGENDEELQQAIKDIYDIDCIIPCFEKLGLSLTVLEDLYLNSDCGCGDDSHVECNMPPNNLTISDILYNHLIPGTVFITQVDILKDYNDPEGDLPLKVKIVDIIQIPNYGTAEVYSGATVVTNGTELLFSDLEENPIKVINHENEEAVYKIVYTIADVGSGVYGETGVFTIIPSYEE